jgi:HEPN domain-containing protein
MAADSSNGVKLGRDVAEWVAKAEANFRSARRLLQTKPPLTCQSCFHSYECADKYVKAVLTHIGVRCGNTLPLTAAFARLEKRLSEWRAHRASALLLAGFDEAILYPGRTATLIEAHAARRHCATLRSQARSDLGLPTDQGPLL